LSLPRHQVSDTKNCSGYEANERDDGEWDMDEDDFCDVPVAIPLSKLFRWWHPKEGKSKNNDHENTNRYGQDMPDRPSHFPSASFEAFSNFAIGFCSLCQG
jgi:hypothetical protein